MNSFLHPGIGPHVAIGLAVANLTPAKAIRFLEHEASFCRSKDQHEALCLLLPALLEVLGLERMNGYEAEEFRTMLKRELSCPAKH